MVFVVVSTASNEAVIDRPVVTVDIYSDVVCPWCYIGKRRFENGLALVDDDLGVDIEVTYHAYQLDPTAAPGVATPVAEAYAKKFGGEERAREILTTVTEAAAGDGIEFNMDRALRANTLLAHRLIWLAGQPDSPVIQADLKERLMQAYFTDGQHIGSPEVLVDCAVELGFDRAQVDEFMSSDRGVAQVRAELDGAHELGISAVPTYVFNNQWAVPGAQDADTFAKVLRKMAANAVGGDDTAG